MKILHENLLKNFFVIVLLVLLFYPIQSFLLNNQLLNDKIAAQSIIISMSLISVIACFGMFTFTYEKINVKSGYQRALGHFTTGIMLLIVGICLIFSDVLLTMLMGSFIVVHFMLVLLYLACVGFDFWDLLRIKSV